MQCVLFLVLMQTERARARDKRAPIRDHYAHSFFASTNLPQHHNLIQNCISRRLDRFREESVYYIEGRNFLSTPKNDIIPVLVLNQKHDR